MLCQSGRLRVRQKRLLKAGLVSTRARLDAAGQIWSHIGYSGRNRSLAKLRASGRSASLNGLSDTTHTQPNPWNPLVFNRLCIAQSLFLSAQALANTVEPVQKIEIAPIEHVSIAAFEELPKVSTELPAPEATIRPAKIRALQHCGPGNGGAGQRVGNVAGQLMAAFGPAGSLASAIFKGAATSIAAEAVGSKLEDPAEKRFVCIDVGLLDDKSIHKTQVTAAFYNKMRLRLGRQIDAKFIGNEMVDVDWK